ncbi:MAG: DUF1801 domain-containing protein [Candidatus Nanoarchaeia archaeon]
MNNLVDEYIGKQNSMQKKILKELRELIKKSLPTISEEMKGGVPCYGVSPKTPYGICYIVGLKDHVNIGFLTINLNSEELKLLKGNGKTMRPIEINSLKELNKEEITKLLQSVNKKN